MKKKIQDMTADECKDEFKKLVDKITDVRALRFFYRFVYEVATDTPEIFKEGNDE